MRMRPVLFLWGPEDGKIKLLDVDAFQHRVVDSAMAQRNIVRFDPSAPPLYDPFDDIVTYYFHPFGFQGVNRVDDPLWIAVPNTMSGATDAEITLRLIRPAIADISQGNDYGSRWL